MSTTQVEDDCSRPTDGSAGAATGRWKDILLRVWRGTSEDRILLVAGGVTFYLILAIFPAIAAVISIYGLFADPVTVVNQLDAVAHIAPRGRDRGSA
jgi:uncharacterized BrkB/YihY/UPF0761 family membrane protein